MQMWYLHHPLDEISQSDHVEEVGYDSARYYDQFDY